MQQIIDPQLLAEDGIADASSQSEVAYLDQEFGDMNLDFSAFECEDPAFSAAYLDIELAYPEQPLMDMVPKYQPLYQPHYQPEFQPGYQPGFNPGLFLEPQLPMGPVFTAPEYPCLRCLARDQATQASEVMPLVAPIPTGTLTVPAPPTAMLPKQYSLRARKTKGVEKPQARKKVRRSASKVNKHLPQLESLAEPFSKLAATMPNYKEIDMDAFVRRGVEGRIKKGQSCRPANAFILYRIAYSQVASHVLKSNQHQNISRLVGASWGLESEAVKSRFGQLAELEKEYHSMIFPSYKFAPVQSRSKVPSLNASDNADYSPEKAEDCILAAWY
ncbi:hypothetical protein F5Y03DRAFT_399058 [Xylaria venustula]|nr:hypothetical protein F5Y03DRAFT_399058 [Xylaria venustula]